MKVAVEGCMHGELTKMYETIAEIERREGYKIDLLLCCGDFQATRNLTDLKCMAVPDKFKDMGSFYQYYSGEKVAPVLTIFIGGNHEASNYLQELPYGGWAAPNIYYLGYAGVVEFNGLRIAGLSGIYKGMDYLKGRFERPPYDQSSLRSVYHIRNIDVFRLRQLNEKPDVVLSHDWPRGIHNYGNVGQLLRQKQFFKEDIEANKLGSRPAMEILETLKPEFWFSAHLHVKFPALVEHDDGGVTKFLALDKCLPNRKFLQILDIDGKIENPKNSKLRFDPAWISILRSTNHLVSVEKKDVHMPGPRYSGRWDFRPSDDEIEEIVQILAGKLEIPETFELTEPAFDPSSQNMKMMWQLPGPTAKCNPQTTWFCSKFDLDNPIDLLCSNVKRVSPESVFKVSDFSSPSDDIKRDLSSCNLTKTDDVTSEFNSFNQDEIVLSDEDEGEKVPVSVETIQSKRTFLSLPSPKRKLDSDDVEAEQKKEDLAFAVDKVGAGETLQQNTPAKKTLKRRNQAMYVAEDD